MLENFHKSRLIPLILLITLAACSEEIEQKDPPANQEVNAPSIEKNTDAKTQISSPEKPNTSTPIVPEQASQATETLTRPYSNNSDGSRTYISGATICAAEVPKDAKRQECSWKGSSISFYAEGQNFVSLDKNSLTIETLTIDGKDILKNRKQELNYELGSFPKASKDSKYLIWNVNIPEGYHSPDAKLRIKGRVNAYTSEKLLEESSTEFNYRDFASFELGPISIKGTRVDQNKKVNDFLTKDKNLSKDDIQLLSKIIGENDNYTNDQAKEQAIKSLEQSVSSPEKLQLLMSKLVSYMLTEALSGPTNQSGESDKFDLTVTTDSKVIDRIEVYSNNKKVRNQSTWRSNNTSTYNFEKPSSDQVSVKVFYWQNPTSVSVNLDF